MSKEPDLDNIVLKNEKHFFFHMIILLKICCSFFRRPNEVFTLSLQVWMNNERCDETSGLPSDCPLRSLFHYSIAEVSAQLKVTLSKPSVICASSCFLLGSALLTTKRLLLCSHTADIPHVRFGSHRMATVVGFIRR